MPEKSTNVKIAEIKKDISHILEKIDSYKKELDEWKRDYVTRLELNSALTDVRISIEKSLSDRDKITREDLNARRDQVDKRIALLEGALQPMLDDFESRLEDRQKLKWMIISLFISAIPLSSLVSVIVRKIIDA